VTDRIEKKGLISLSGHSSCVFQGVVRREIRSIKVIDKILKGIEVGITERTQKAGAVRGKKIRRKKEG